MSKALEDLLRDAASDPALAAELKADPLATVDRRGYSLSPEERGVLAALGPAELTNTLETLGQRPLPPPIDPELVVCGGVRPDYPIGPSQGIRPDYPIEPTRGIRPDSPVRGTRPGRVLLAAAATTAIAGAGYLAIDRMTGSDPGPTHQPAAAGDQEAAAPPDGGAPPAEPHDPSDDVR